jgi:D-serine dehydratase
MLIRLGLDDAANAAARLLTVYGPGLGNCTEADGLAVACAPTPVSALLRKLVSGIATMRGATHVSWSTGGRFVPATEHRHLRQRGAAVAGPTSLVREWGGDGL